MSERPLSAAPVAKEDNFLMNIFLDDAQELAIYSDTKLLEGVL